MKSHEEHVLVAIQRVSFMPLRFGGLGKGDWGSPPNSEDLPGQVYACQPEIRDARK
jgi:hypothetical protein